MTAKEYYDLLVETSRTGGFPATDARGECAYRTESGRKCAAGLLIPDEKYSVAFENHLVGALPADAVVLPDGVELVTVREVQQAHDEQARDIVKGCRTGWDHAYFVARVADIKAFAELAVTP